MMDIYPREDTDYSEFSSYFHWQRVCRLVKKDIDDDYFEIDSHSRSLMYKSGL